MATYTHAQKRFAEIWLFYANIIGYVRFIMIMISMFFANIAVHQNSFNWAILAFIFNYTGGWLLDWIVSIYIEKCNVRDFILRMDPLQGNTNSVLFLVLPLTGMNH